MEYLAVALLSTGLKLTLKSYLVSISFHIKMVSFAREMVWSANMILVVVVVVILTVYSQVPIAELVVSGYLFVEREEQ